jgi:hypothetical protein
MLSAVNSQIVKCEVYRAVEDSGLQGCDAVSLHLHMLKGPLSRSR